MYRLIEQRQQDSLGMISEVRLAPPTDTPSAESRMYDFAPRSVEPALPAEFAPRHEAEQAAADENDAEPGTGEDKSAAASAGGEVVSAEEMSPGIFTPSEKARATVLGLREGLSFAMAHGRDLQNAREELYLAALDLSLERHLWTPQFVAALTADAEFVDPGGLNDDQRALTAVSDISLTQQLPYGGAITAQILSTLVRDLETHVTSGESGSMILQADLPLLRGAGRVAYESRYSAERELVYAVRRYERYRRSYLVDVASRYFDLQRSQAAISNAYKSYQSRKGDWERAAVIKELEQDASVFDEPRAKSSLRRAEANLVSAKEQHRTALDRFKIFIGMPVDTLLDVVGQDEDEQSRALDHLLPEVNQATAIETALCYRLDLLTEADRMDDARRAVVVAKNGLLPDLDLTAGVTWNTDPERLNSVSYNLERSTYRAGISLQMDDRRTEQNAYRAALVALRRAQRNYEESVDTVRADVRRALWTIQRDENLRMIQGLNVQENLFRYEAADAQYKLGKITNQDLVDADDDLLAARNDLAGAVAAYRIAILVFRLDTGTLRITDDGRWDELASFLAPAPGS